VLTRSWAHVRPADPTQRRAPNWERLPSGALLLQPTEDERHAFDELLAQRTPPGPQYRELVDEIWSRGYEVFVVGGTVRDIVGGEPSHDVDLVTTMPLNRARALLQSMYGPIDARAAGARNGHVRLGGARDTADPFIDLSIFKVGAIGGPDALFGDCFVADVAHRDFTLNALYYDPVNQVLVDPTGLGVQDAEARTLRVVCEVGRRVPRQIARVAVRFFKLRLRGFAPADGCGAVIAGEFAPMLSSLPEPERIGVFRKQLLSDVQAGERAAVLARVQQEFATIGVEGLWHSLVAPLEEEILEEEALL
jgi:hypothetical protein